MDEDDRQFTPGEIFYARTFALLTLFGLGFFVYQILSPFFAPLAWAFFIAFLLHPLHEWLTAKLRGRANLSATLLTLATLVILIGPLAALGAAFVAQLADLLEAAQRLASEGRTALPDLTAIPVLGAMLEWLQRSFGVSLTEVQRWVVEGARNVLQLLAPLGGRIFLGALSTVTGFILTMFILFFAIRDSRKLFVIARALVPMGAVHKAHLFDYLAAVARAVVYGSGVTALVQGALLTVGFSIVGLPSPIVFGVIAALFALVPMIGTPIVWLPAVAVLATQQRWVAAIFLLAWGALLVATIDNVLRPLLVSGRVQVGTLTVFIGVLGGVSAFGAIGLFLGPLVLALVAALVRFTLELRRAEAAKARAPGDETPSGEP